MELTQEKPLWMTAIWLIHSFNKYLLSMGLLSGTPRRANSTGAEDVQVNYQDNVR